MGDERLLPPHYVATLCKQMLSLPTNNVPHFSQRNEFLKCIDSKLEAMPLFWDAHSRRKKPIVNVSMLRRQLMPSRIQKRNKQIGILLAVALVLILLYILFYNEEGQTDFQSRSYNSRSYPRSGGYRGR